VQQQIAAIAHDVFVSAYISAMKSTLVVPIAFLAFTALTALLLRRVPVAQTARQATQEEDEEVKAAAS
jgi:hypothetical protein